jgi:hypothetical protein
MNRFEHHDVHIQHRRTLRTVHVEQDEEKFANALARTAFGCVAAAAVTYPISQWEMRYLTKALTEWSSKEYIPRERSQLRRVISPMSRLLFQEISLQLTEQYSREHYHFEIGSRMKKEMSEEVVAGALSGVAQALLLCPLAAREAKLRQKDEVESNKAMKGKRLQKWTNPAERLKRAYRGVSLLAVREVLFNVTFFPMAFYLRRFVGDSWLTPVERNVLSEWKYYFSLDNLVTWRSNVAAGAVCSLLVTPVDVMRTYYWHSGVAWSLWKGRTTVSPPLSLLFRGWFIQALVMGPTFGTVATIYMWNYDNW